MPEDLNGLRAKAAVNYAAMSANPDHRGDVDKTFSAYVLSAFDDFEQSLITEALARTENSGSGSYQRKRLAWELLDGEFG